jgi:hypothetical protein
MTAETSTPTQDIARTGTVGWNGQLVLTGETYQVSLRFADPADRVKATRVYVDADVYTGNGTDLVLDALVEAEKNLGDKRWSRRGECPEVDDLYDTMNARIKKAEVKVAKDILALFLPDLDTDGARYSAKAGCSCPCSPGVVLKAAYRVDSYRVEQVWINKLPTDN